MTSATENADSLRRTLQKNRTLPGVSEPEHTINMPQMSKSKESGNKIRRWPDTLSQETTCEIHRHNISPTVERLWSKKIFRSAYKKRIAIPLQWMIFAPSPHYNDAEANPSRLSVPMQAIVLPTSETDTSEEISHFGTLRVYNQAADALSGAPVINFQALIGGARFRIFFLRPSTSRTSD